MKAQACIKSQTISFVGDVETFFKPAMEFEISPGNMIDRMQDLDVAQGYGILLHETDHLYRGKTTSVGWLYKLTEYYRICIGTSLIVSAFVPEDVQSHYFSDKWEKLGFLGLIKSGVGTSAQVTNLLTSISFFQQYLESGPSGFKTSPEEIEAGIARASDGLEWIRCLVSGNEMVFRSESLNETMQIVEQFCRLPSVGIIPRDGEKERQEFYLSSYLSVLNLGFIPLFEFLADLTAKRITSYLPERGSSSLSDLPHRERNRRIRDSLPSLNEDEIVEASIRSSLPVGEYLHLFSGVYDAVYSWCGKWLLPFVESRIAVFGDKEHKYGDYNIYPTEFWAAIYYALNPPILSNNNFDLSQITSLDQLDCSSRFLSARVYLDKHLDFTPLEPDALISERRFRECTFELYKHHGEAPLSSVQQFLQANSVHDTKRSIVSLIDSYIGLDSSYDLVGKNDFETLLTMQTHMQNHKVIHDGERFDINDAGIVFATLLDCWAETGFAISPGKIHLREPEIAQFHPYIEVFLADEVRSMTQRDDLILEIEWAIN